MDAIKAGKGITFKVVGDGNTYNFLLPMKRVRDWGHHAKNFKTENGVETEVTILWSDLKQPTWASRMPFDIRNLEDSALKVDFSTDPGATVAFKAKFYDLVILPK